MRCFLIASPLLFMWALLHCSGSSNAIGDGSDAAVRNPACPNTPPTLSAACALADGTTCNNYPSASPGCYCCASGGGGFECSGGKWIAIASPSGNTPTASPCPVTVPTQGDSCQPQCAGALQSCSYDCAHGNGYSSTATCQNGGWQVQKSLTPCAAPDASFDAADSGDARD